MSKPTIKPEWRVRLMGETGNGSRVYALTDVQAAEDYAVGTWSSLDYATEIELEVRCEGSNTWLPITVEVRAEPVFTGRHDANRNPTIDESEDGRE